MVQIHNLPIALVPEIPELAYEWRNDVRVWGWCRQYTLLTRADHDKWLRSLAERSDVKMFGIRCMESGVDIGVCGFTSIDRVNQKAEFSLYIAPDFRGNNKAAPTLATLFAHGFWDMNLNRIWGETYSGNPAARIFEKIGMVKEGILKGSYFRYGHFIDSYIYGLTRDEFNHNFTSLFAGLSKCSTGNIAHPLETPTKE